MKKDDEAQELIMSHIPPSLRAFTLVYVRGGAFGGEIKGESFNVYTKKKGLWDQKWAWQPKAFGTPYSQPPHLQKVIYNPTYGSTAPTRRPHHITLPQPLRFWLACTLLPF